MKNVLHGIMPEVGKLKCKPFAEALERLRGKPVLITVVEAKPTRSNQQNRYYWGVVIELIYDALKESGWEITREATHELLRVRFLSEDRPIGDDGQFATYVKSTTELDTFDFGMYLEHCCRFAAEYLNTVIPAPNEQLSIAQEQEA